MKKVLILTIFAVGFLFATTANTWAVEKIAGQSATTTVDISAQNTQNKNAEYLTKTTVIRKMLKEYNSPLIGDIDAFITTCKKYSLDCYLLPAIAGLESSFGAKIYPNSYNPFGWGGGYMMFRNWSEAIDTVGKGLRTNYIDKGATTISQIGRIYAPPSTTWASRVEFFVKRFYNEEQKVQNVKDLL
ncbi:MAG TPA: hypothetical protein VJH96_00345 [Patescibacteria group bacterium]|nr:hypothetical protein [Patescibacteria group bacterium]